MGFFEGGWMWFSLGIGVTMVCYLIVWGVIMYRSK